MSILDVLQRRRSCRSYKADNVSSEAMMQILEAGNYAPSGGNTKQTKIFSFENPKLIASLEHLVEQAFSQMEIKENMYKSMKNSIVLSKKGHYHFAYQAPVLILCANKKCYPNSMADSAVILENMMIAATALELGTCYVNQVHWLTSHPCIREFLKPFGLEEDEDVFGGIVLGHPKNMPQKQPKRKQNQIIRITKEIIS